MWQLVGYSWRGNYTAFWLTKWYHSWPHVEYKSFTLVDSSFQPDSDEYFQTLLFLAAIPIALLLLTILAVFFYCCYGFCRKRRSNSIQRSPRKNPTSKKWVLATVALFCLAFIVIGFYGNEETSTGVHRLTNAAKDVDITIDEITTEVNKISATYSNDIPRDVQTLNDTFQKVLNQQDREKLLKLTATLSQHTTSTAQNIAEINRDSNSVQLNLTTKADDLESYDYFRWLGTIILFSLESIVCLIALCAVGKASRCLLVFVSVVCLIFIILIWCRMGIEIFITVGASDFCVKPSVYVLSQTDKTTNLDQDIVEYYLTCYPNSQNPYGSTLRDSQKAQALAETTLEDIKEITKIAYPQATDTLDKLNQTFQSTSIQLQSLVANINCNTLNNDYVIGLYSLCYDTITGISFMMLSSILSGLFFTVLIFISSCTVPVIARRKADYEVDREDPFLPPENPSATLERYSHRGEPRRSPQRGSGLGSPTIPDYNREPSFAASSVAYNQDYRYEDDPLLRRHGHDSPPPSYTLAMAGRSRNQALQESG
ncbi:protein tweety homolog 1-A-like isoform X2 [Anneissia japonica]|uniref:protein tweety homolog 1-A-like isoform X2 n=1 Tax=Anneissia japonica TaxID=1529436 RepID=UPI0014257C4E|nr:protein tweety homolog 1-A-like isoform X2 [Anneissia japonica]